MSVEVVLLQLFSEREFCIDNLQGLLEIKDTHRPEEGPMLLGIELP